MYVVCLLASWFRRGRLLRLGFEAVAFVSGGVGKAFDDVLPFVLCTYFYKMWFRGWGFGTTDRASLGSTG
jgi:hypothetical protein